SVRIKKVTGAGIIGPRVTYRFWLSHGWRTYHHRFSVNPGLRGMELPVGARDFKAGNIRRSPRSQPIVHVVEMYRRLRSFYLELLVDRATVNNVLPVAVVQRDGG